MSWRSHQRALACRRVRGPSPATASRSVISVRLRLGRGQPSQGALEHRSYRLARGRSQKPHGIGQLCPLSKRTHHRLSTQSIRARVSHGLFYISPTCRPVRLTGLAAMRPPFLAVGASNPLHTALPGSSEAIREIETSSQGR
jgi:hypothetical protein